MGPARHWPLLAATLAAGVFASAVPAVLAQEADPHEVPQTGWISEKIDVQTGGHGVPELIFLSDLAMPAAVWDHVVARFEVTHRCHVVLPAGFGAKPSAWTSHFLDATADAIIAYARAEHLARPVLVGHGLGGMLALKIALKAPDLPGRLVLVDCLPYPSEGGVRSAPVDAAADLARYVRGGTEPAEETTAIAQEARQSNPTAVWQAAAELLATDLQSDLGWIRCPTLVLGTLAGPGAPPRGGSTSGSTGTCRGCALHFSGRCGASSWWTISTVSRKRCAAN